VLLIPALLLSALSASGVFLFADSAFLEFGNHPGGVPFPLVHFASNAYMSWDFPPFVPQLLKWGGYPLYAALLLVIGAVGASCWLRRRMDEGCIHPELLLILFQLLLLQCFGIDIVVFSFLACLPWQMLAIDALLDRENEGQGGYLLLAASSLLCCLLCHQLALLCSVAAFSVSLLERPVPEHCSRFTCLFTTVFLIDFAALLFYPTPLFPQYPSRGHLVPSYGVVDGLQPLAGDAPRLNCIDRQFLRSALAWPSVVLASLALLVWVLESVYSGKPTELLRHKARRRALPAAAFLLAAAAWLDSSMIPADWSQLAPLQSAARIFPGWYFFPLAIIVLAVGGFFLVCAAACELRAKICFAVVSVLLLVTGAFRQPFFRTAADASFWTNILTHDEPRQLAFRPFLTSPSYYLLREFGLDVLRDAEERRAIQYLPVAQFPVSLSSSAGPVNIADISDGDGSTRWSSGGGGQSGDEWLKLAFPAATVVRGLRLETGRFYTDFPRGLKIFAAADCEAVEGEQGARVLYERRANEGEILYTEDGFPYFGTQYDISVPLLHADPLRCLVIRQIGADANFQWSVSELELAAEIPSLPKEAD
jgi:hypothetical protein